MGRLRFLVKLEPQTLTIEEAWFRREKGNSFFPQWLLKIPRTKLEINIIKESIGWDSHKQLHSTHLYNSVCKERKVGFRKPNCGYDIFIFSNSFLFLFLSFSFSLYYYYYYYFFCWGQRRLRVGVEEGFRGEREKRQRLQLLCFE